MLAILSCEQMQQALLARHNAHGGQAHALCIIPAQKLMELHITLFPGLAYFIAARKAAKT